MRWMRNSRASASRLMPLMRATWAATRNNGSYLQDYRGLGDRYLSDRDKHRVTQRLLRRLQTLGVVVAVKPA